MSESLHERYGKAAETLRVLAGIILLEFARHQSSTRNQIARNFVARADATVTSIFKLWEIGDFGDCWVLYRTLVDRLFHLYALNRDDQFDAFDDWSFKAQYEAANRLRSDPLMKDRLEGVVDEPTDEQKARYQRLVLKPPQWRRPKPEQTAKDMGLGMLNAYGYDFASTHVHPMANDGQEDFFRLTGLKPAPAFPDWSVALNNSVLVWTMTIQEALNASSLRWRAIVYDGLEGIRQYLGTGEVAYFAAVAKCGGVFAKGQALAATSEADSQQA